MNTFTVTLDLPRPNLQGNSRLFLAVRTVILDEMATLALSLSKEKSEFTLDQVQALEETMAMINAFCEETRQRILAEEESMYRTFNTPAPVPNDIDTSEVSPF